jgi:hypothetical protein
LMFLSFRFLVPFYPRGTSRTAINNVYTTILAMIQLLRFIRLIGGLKLTLPTSQSIG